jgi:tRNA threonylcarbamoyl adenosine modification protein YeaZ
VSLYLAIETATDVGSVAVGEPGRAASEVLFGERRHASDLTPAVEETLRLAGATYGDLSGIVVANGPGSFTGLRIGAATAKGMLRVHDRLTLHEAPSLLAAAWVAHRSTTGPVAALYDALRGDVFGAVYEVSDQSVVERVAPTCCPVAELVQRAPVAPDLAVGDGAALYADEVRQWTGRNAVGPPAGAPRASALLELLAVERGTARVEDPQAFEPEYGRLATAQVRWEAEHGRPLPRSDGTSG